MPCETSPLFSIDKENIRKLKLWSEKASIEEMEDRKGDSRTSIKLQYLSTLSYEQKQFEGAFDIAMWLYESRREMLGDNHPSTACSFTHIEELKEQMKLLELEREIPAQRMESGPGGSHNMDCTFEQHPMTKQGVTSTILLLAQS